MKHLVKHSLYLKYVFLFFHAPSKNILQIFGGTTLPLEAENLSGPAPLLGPAPGLGPDWDWVWDRDRDPNQDLDQYRDRECN